MPGIFINVVKKPARYLRGGSGFFIFRLKRAFYGLLVGYLMLFLIN